MPGTCRGCRDGLAPAAQVTDDVSPSQPFNVAQLQLLHVVSLLELCEALALLRGVILLLPKYDRTCTGSIVGIGVVYVGVSRGCLRVLRLQGLLCRSEVLIYDHFFLHYIWLLLHFLDNVLHHLQTELLLL